MDRKVTKEQWLKEGKALYGENFLDWKFKCPACGHIQSIADFKKYKAQGAKAEDAYFNCIGRFSGGRSWLSGEAGSTPCDYTGGGLIGLNPVCVLDGDKKTYVFEFADKQESK